MGSKITLKNGQDQEFSINHKDNVGAISIDSEKIKYVNNVTSDIQTQLDGKLSTSGKASDSDKLDGLDSSSFFRRDANDYVQIQTTYSNPDANINFENQNSISKGLMIQSDSGTNSDALLTFHNGGQFACHFGLDRTTNDLAVGGWSMGSVANKIWHNGNNPIVKQGNGYAIYANGNIEQWGQLNSSATLDTVNFPIAFPTRCVFATATLRGITASYASLYVEPSTTQASFIKSNGYGMSWYAVGH